MTHISLMKTEMKNKFSIIRSILSDLQVKKAASLSDKPCIPQKGDDVLPKRKVDLMKVNFASFILLYFILFLYFHNLVTKTITCFKQKF